jgi:hypothetical protein
MKRQARSLGPSEGYLTNILFVLTVASILLLPVGVGVIVVWGLLAYIPGFPAFRPVEGNGWVGVAIVWGVFVAWIGLYQGSR